MIDAEVKWIEDLPNPPTNVVGAFAQAITVGIGRKNDDGADIFHVVVCNSGWVDEQVSNDSAFWPRGYLIVQSFDFDHIEELLKALVGAFSQSADWASFVQRLNRYLFWEYGDVDDFQSQVPVPRRRVH